MHPISIQIATDEAPSPKKAVLRRWATRVLKTQPKQGEMTIRIVDINEMTILNKTFRKKEGPTNVLSFPYIVPADVALFSPVLGDIVICAKVVEKEAKEQHIMWEAHWAHMVVHGIYHLLGYDHETDHDAICMEKQESDSMQSLGFNNPYINRENDIS
jgi:probable rRNA maturation factor